MFNIEQDVLFHFDDQPLKEWLFGKNVVCGFV